MTKPRSKLSVATLTMILLSGFLPAAFGHEVSLSCPAAFGTVPDASGLIAYYPLDGNAVDATGNGMDAIEVIAAEPVKGKIGQGYYFNGKDSHILLPLDISPYAYSQITVTAWIKAETVKQKRYVVSQGEKGDRNLFIYNSAVSASRALVGDPKHTIYPDRWTFVALTYDQAADTAVLLSDSTFSALDKVGIPEQPFPSVLLGARAPGNSVFAGVIDEVRIYSRALTTTELAGLRNGSSPTRVAGSGEPNQIRVLDGSNMSQPGQSSRDNQATPAFDESSPAIFSSPPPAGTPSQNFDESSPAIFTEARPPADKPSQNFDESSPAIFTEARPPADKPSQNFDESSPAIFTSAAGDGQNVGSNPVVLPRDQLENPSVADIPAGPNYQAADQKIDYVTEGTMLMPDPSTSTTSGGGAGSTRTTQQVLMSGDGFKYAPGEAYLTGISGKRGSIVRRVMIDESSEIGANSVWVTERKDKICRLDLAGRKSVVLIDECTFGPNAILKYFDKKVRLGDGYQIASIQVCTRASNDRVKGLRIRGIELTSTGLGSAWEQDELTFPNCKGNWKTLVMCPSGQIASGIGAHFVRNKGVNKNIAALVGIQLYCRALVPKN
ncbi:MAG: hypothetical protein GXP15_12550 [Gammaproteobacteria bacterium]|nr:hypothetical protein [Gammaproteobacteria bacterium]